MLLDKLHTSPQHTFCKDIVLTFLGEVSDELVRYVAQAVMISWGESIFHKMAINSAPRLTSSKNTLDTLQTNLVSAVKDTNLGLEMQLKRGGRLQR